MLLIFWDKNNHLKAHLIKDQTTHDDKKIVFMLSTTRISAEWSVISEFQNTSEKITVKFSKKHSDWMCMYMCACVCDYVVWWGYYIKFIMDLCLLLWLVLHGAMLLKIQHLFEIIWDLKICFLRKAQQLIILWLSYTSVE